MHGRAMRVSLQWLPSSIRVSAGNRHQNVQRDASTCKCPFPSDSGIAPVSAYKGVAEPTRDLHLVPEGSRGMVLMLGAAALLFGVAGRQQTQEALVGWSQQHWREAKCLVHEAGIEYTGDCNVHLEDADYGAWPPVKKSFAVAPGYKYQRCPEVFRSSRTHCSELKPETAQADGINMPRYNLIVCHHSFLPWALVQVEGDLPAQGFGSLQSKPTESAYGERRFTEIGARSEKPTVHVSLPRDPQLGAWEPGGGQWA
ncbi:unnamed protein product [Effrenium voratum]|nr:unnamed protein product [Effrenium voratum]